MKHIRPIHTTRTVTSQSKAVHTSLTAQHRSVCASDDFIARCGGGCRKRPRIYYITSYYIIIRGRSQHRPLVFLVYRHCRPSLFFFLSKLEVRPYPRLPISERGLLFGWFPKFTGSLYKE